MKQKYENSKGFDIGCFTSLKTEKSDYRFMYFKISHSYIVHFVFYLILFRREQIIKKKYKAV